MKNKKTSKDKAFNAYKFERVNIMINQENKNQKRICSFFASDYHFEMISLPFIEKELEDEKKIIVFTENNLDNTIEKVLKNINLKEEKKNKIKKLDWKSETNLKLQELKNCKDSQEMVVFIKGGESYIQSMNQKLDEIISNKNVKIIDCYDINQMNVDLTDVAQNYSEVLNTMGKMDL